MELPNEAELCEQVILAQPKPHCIKYTEKFRVIETDILKLKEFFEDCHNADVHSGEYKRITKANKKKKEHGKPKKEQC